MGEKVAVCLVSAIAGLCLIGGVGFAARLRKKRMSDREGIRESGEWEGSKRMRRRQEHESGVMERSGWY